jgi:hypothetical protein
MSQAPRTQQSGGWQSAIDWQTFFTASNEPVIGYDPLNDKVLILKSTDISESDDSDILAYDMRTGAWSTVKSAIPTSTDRTNFVVNGAGELVIKQSDSTGAFYRWSNTAEASSTFQWTSKAFDFGHPGLKKKIYKVIVHSKNGDNIVVKAGYDDEDAENKFTSNTLSSSADFFKNELEITTPTACSYFTVQIESSGTSNAGFEINDIGILYRIIRQH